jgi:hypothetical protein
MTFTFDIVGLDQFKQDIATASETVLKEVDNELNASMLNMKAGAQRDAPKDQSLLVGEISADTEPFLRKSLVSRASYSAFVEFGTKSHVSIPPGLEAEAAKFRGQTTGGTLGAKQAIFQWCARHGIDKKFWYPIFIKIMVNGIRPRPFFFKQLQDEQPRLIERLKAIL